MRASQSGGSPHCRICSVINEEPNASHPNPVEDVQHILTACVGTAKIRETILPKIETAVGLSKSSVDFSSIKNSPHTLTQFLLDCTSLNLSNSLRVNFGDPNLKNIFTEARHYINAVHLERIRKLSEIEKKRKNG